MSDQQKTAALLRRLFALARTGLHFAGPQYRSDANSVFDRERYEEIGRIAAELLAAHSHAPLSELMASWRLDDGYTTPKIDVRGAVFRDGKILLVRERSDGQWTLPGGWADVNESPARAVEKEIVEESGFTARAIKLAAVYERAPPNTPATVFHAWKFFFICDLLGGEAQVSHETDAVDFFTLDALPELSQGRTTAWQIKRMFAHRRELHLPTEFD